MKTIRGIIGAAAIAALALPVACGHSSSNRSTAEPAPAATQTPSATNPVAPSATSDSATSPAIPPTSAGTYGNQGAPPNSTQRSAEPTLNDTTGTTQTPASEPLAPAGTGTDSTTVPISDRLEETPGGSEGMGGGSGATRDAGTPTTDGGTPKADGGTPAPAPKTP